MKRSRGEVGQMASDSGRRSRPTDGGRCKSIEKEHAFPLPASGRIQGGNSAVRAGTFPAMTDQRGHPMEDKTVVKKLVEAFELIVAILLGLGAVGASVPSYQNGR